MSKPDLITRFVFNDTTVVEISSDYEETIMIEVSNVDDPEDGGRVLHLKPDEAELFISALNLYKNRVKGDKFND